MREMLTTVRRKGPAGLYWGFLPHCFEACPHDISEMLVMGSMKVGRDAEQRWVGHEACQYHLLCSLGPGWIMHPACSLCRARDSA